MDWKIHSEYFGVLDTVGFIAQIACSIVEE